MLDVTIFLECFCLSSGLERQTTAGKRNITLVFLTYVDVSAFPYWKTTTDESPVGVEKSGRSVSRNCGTCLCDSLPDSLGFEVVRHCSNDNKTMLVHNLRVDSVDLTKVLTQGADMEIQIMNTTLKTIRFNSINITFQYLVFKENYRLSIHLKDFYRSRVAKILFRINAVEFLDHEVFNIVERLELISMKSTSMLLGNQKDPWEGNRFTKLIIRGPHIEFVKFEKYKNLEEVEISIVWSDTLDNVVPQNFLKESHYIWNLSISRANNMVLQNNFMQDMVPYSALILTVDVWNIDERCLSHMIKTLNGQDLTDQDRELFDPQSSKHNCSQLCKCGAVPGNCAECAGDQMKKNCAVCVRNFMTASESSSVTNARQLFMSICHVDSWQILNGTAPVPPPPPPPAQPKQDYAPNMGNDYEFVTRRRNSATLISIQLWIGVVMSRVRGWCLQLN